MLTAAVTTPLMPMDHTGAVNLNDGVGGGVDIGGQTAAVVGLGSPWPP